MSAPDNIEAFRLGEQPSDGLLTCDSICSDGHSIRRGAPVFWKQTSSEYDEWRPVCHKHAIDESTIDYSDINDADG